MASFSDTRGSWSNRVWLARPGGVLPGHLSPLCRDETIFAGTDSALYFSYNGGRAWRPLPFPEDAAPILSLAVSPDFAQDQTLFAGTEGNGLHRSQNRGQSWQKLDLPAASVNALLFSANGRLLATSRRFCPATGET
jgi:photosystem II stability/assembly factor-like uncharacterized protein